MTIGPGGWLIPQPQTPPPLQLSQRPHPPQPLAAEATEAVDAADTADAADAGEAADAAYGDVTAAAT
jgi:hypothetical protein